MKKLTLIFILFSLSSRAITQNITKYHAYAIITGKWNFGKKAYDMDADFLPTNTSVLSSATKISFTNNNLIQVFDIVDLNKDFTTSTENTVTYAVNTVSEQTNEICLVTIKAEKDNFILIDIIYKKSGNCVEYKARQINE